ncbi:G-protein coupled receptor GRL101-like [Anneissia japonica]|uniref:G-protein coupled receptor GRL101-like n=1 Tax=Anneissia japonica TaxID=1529436 RepID=UPI001425695E|nr:G-protein coupled receptor GRL101-like [Anneissia japonica]
MRKQPKPTLKMFIFKFNIFLVLTTTCTGLSGVTINCPTVCTCKDFKVKCTVKKWNRGIVDPSLKYLSLSGNAIIYLKVDAFSDLTSLNILDLSSNKIYFPWVSPLSYPHSSMFISFELFRHIPETPSAFRYLRNLQILNLHRNEITVMGQSFFIGSISLKTLDLNRNKLQGIDLGVFNGLTSLQKLHLSWNKINALPRGVFSSLRSLKTLDLHNNEITGLQQGLFNELTSLETLDLSSNIIAYLRQNAFKNLARLQTLDLYDNIITDIEQGAFNSLTSLKTLVLSRNAITNIKQGAFNGLTSLQSLHLCWNKITYLQQGTFNNLTSLQTLHLCWNKIAYLQQGAFNGLKSLQFLDLSDNTISKITKSAFSGLTSIRKLDLQNNVLSYYKPDSFKGLTSLETLLSDEFSICCIKEHVPNCKPNVDQFSSCKDLLKREALRILMFILGISAFIGNLCVVILRLVENEFNVQTIFITNLAVSDLLMSVYMIIIAGADQYYRGVYSMFSGAWKSSFLCSFAGAIATLSSECSVFILMLMSVDRAVTIAYPFSNIRFNRKRCIITIGITWLAIIFISFLPMFSRLSFINIPYFGDNYYGRQSVCLALPLAGDRLPGWEYAIAIFLAFNLFGFVVIASSYISMYISVKRTASRANRSQVRSEEIKMATKMAMIVLTDFCCWFPIILMGIGSEAGVWMLPDDIYAWSATFILPINSSLNPYLYTIAYKFKRKSSAQVAKVMPLVRSRLSSP